MKLEMMCFTNSSVVPISALLLAFASVAASAEPIRSCDLMSTQTAASVFGSATGSGVEQQISDVGRQCIFDTTSGGQVSIGLMDKANMAALGAKPTDIPRILNQPKPGQHTETVPALGEWNSLMSSPNDTSLSVLQHGYLLTLDVSGSNNPALKAALIQAAKLAMKKL